MVIIAIIFLPSPSHALKKQGLTLQLNFGPSGTHLFPNGLRNENNIEVNGSAFLGYFLNPRLSLGAHLGMNSHPFFIFGPSIQYWLFERFSLNTTLGYTGILFSPKGSDITDFRQNIALSLGGTFYPFFLGNHALGISLEVTPTFPLQEPYKLYTLSYTALISWQY